MSSILDRMKDLIQRPRSQPAGSSRLLKNRPRKSTVGHSARRLNLLASGMGHCDSYLEIGVAQGLTLESVKVPNRVGVDPLPQFDVTKIPRGITFFQMESDSYFENADKESKFDLVFLDGLHVWKQTYKDLINSLHICKPSSIILIDDVVPDDELAAYPDWDKALELKDAAGITDGRWQGDVYKVLLVINNFHPELEYAVIGSRDRIDNPQAIVRVKAAVDPSLIEMASEADLNTVQSCAYDYFFKDEALPDFIELESEESGIKRILDSVTRS